MIPQHDGQRPRRHPTRRATLSLVAVVVAALATGLFACGPRGQALEIEWIDVPAGEFPMGSDPEVAPEASHRETPQHAVYVDAFRMAKYEITTAQYERCVRTEVCRAPRDPTYYADPGYADHPVVHVDWWDARTFCEWLGGRLPTEAEWEYAARGPEGRTYPWGDTFDCARGNFDDETEVDAFVVAGGQGGCDGYERTAPVGSYPDGASWCGAHDMAGNAWEWTSSLFWDYPYRADDGREDRTSVRARVVRGGSWDYTENDARTAFRFVYEPRWITSHVGLRCAMSAEAAPR
jgi:formylglycine-generating enzyme required for sulfatase activity